MATKAKNNSEAQNSSWADLVKKVVYTSLGSASLAKEVLSESSLSKEVIKTIKERASKGKEGFLEILAKEVSNFLGRLNVSEEITKALKGLIINLSASVEFKEKKGKGLHPKTTIHSATVDKE